MITVVIPSQLESYTNGVREVTLECQSENPITLHDVIQLLESKYRGIAFRIIDEQNRIRKHIAIFVGENMVRATDVPLEKDARVQIVGALSGG